MVLDTSTKGISKNTYYNRAKILQDIFPETGSHNCGFITCEVAVVYLCTKLFLRTPSLEETSSCDEGCLQRKKCFPTLQIQHSFLIKEQFSKIIEEHFLLGGASKCCRKNCIGAETTAPPQAGIANIIFQILYIYFNFKYTYSPLPIYIFFVLFCIFCIIYI